jgi:NadR type nicotinamide-nucleotide adenylyltransferase
MLLVKKIVVIGPESTGKSTLCEDLAVYFSVGHRTGWVPEYAREYLLGHGNSYSYADLLTIAGGQIRLEDERAAALEAAHENGRDSGIEKLLFIDTDLYVMKVWCEFVFGKCHPWILEQIAVRKYDGYLLCQTDLPWVKDELREYPDLVTREKLYHIYKDCMINQDMPWAEISGVAGQRLQAGVAAVNALLRF